MKIFTVIGYTNSGKTATIIEIIKELVKRKFKVSSVKNIHIDNFSVDKEGKDSWLHRQAGATVTGLRSNVETTLIFQKQLSIKEMLPHFECDFLALEGFSDEKFVPKILCAKNMKDLEEKFDGSVFAISGVISQEISEYKGVKAINGLKEIEVLADLIEKKAIEKEALLKL